MLPTQWCCCCENFVQDAGILNEKYSRPLTTDTSELLQLSKFGVQEDQPLPKWARGKADLSNDQGFLLCCIWKSGINKVGNGWRFPAFECSQFVADRNDTWRIHWLKEAICFAECSCPLLPAALLLSIRPATWLLRVFNWFTSDLVALYKFLQLTLSVGMSGLYGMSTEGRRMHLRIEHSFKVGRETIRGNRRHAKHAWEGMKWCWEGSHKFHLMTTREDVMLPNCGQEKHNK